jgi:hypothetical protein
MAWLMLTRRWLSVESLDESLEERRMALGDLFVGILC